MTVERCAWIRAPCRSSSSSLCRRQGFPRVPIPIPLLMLQHPTLPPISRIPLRPAGRPAAAPLTRPPAGEGQGGRPSTYLHAQRQSRPNGGRHSAQFGEQRAWVVKRTLLTMTIPPRPCHAAPCAARTEPRPEGGRSTLCTHAPASGEREQIDRCFLGGGSGEGRDVIASCTPGRQPNLHGFSSEILAVVLCWLGPCRVSPFSWLPYLFVRSNFRDLEQAASPLFFFLL